MNYATTEHLCSDLMAADTTEEVVRMLSQAGYWNNANAWRPLGDNPGNLSVVINQQSDPIAALAEKLTNAIDARLINACLVAKRNLGDVNGPQSPKAAVARFIDPYVSSDQHGGDVWDWPSPVRSKHAAKITVAVTGGRKRGTAASVMVADEGEGQSPDDFPSTLCSLSNSNKDGIPFVQGRFNMGGAGSLRFCGSHHLQLIVSRRNPAFLRTGQDPMWGVTVIRREPPRPGHKNSTYTYLAPIDADRRPRCGEVLRFPKEALNIFPDDTGASQRRAPTANGRSSRHGTLIKLYEYLPKLTKRGAVAMHDHSSVLRQLEVSVLRFALPAKIYDCRYAATDPHHPTNSEILYGLASRLDREGASAMELGFPISDTLHITGERIGVTVYAFGLGTAGTKQTLKARLYRGTNSGMVFCLNEQTQGKRSCHYFTRNEVGMSVLNGSLFVVVDCSHMSPGARDDLFMASRDRISETAFAKLLLAEIATHLKDHPKLRALRASRLLALASGDESQTKQAEQIFEKLYAEDAALLKFLFEGAALRGQGGRPPPAPPFHGRQYPTFFRPKKADKSGRVNREVIVGKSLSIGFLTDVEDGYFERTRSPGKKTIYLVNGGRIPATALGGARGELETSRLVLHRGVATLSLRVKDAQERDVYNYELEVTDTSRVQPFVIPFAISYVSTKRSSSGSSSPATPNYELPQLRPITRAQWETFDPPMTEQTAVRLLQTPTGDTRDLAYSWYMNEDNAALVRQTRQAAKDRPADVPVIRSTFVQAMLVAGLAALRTQEQLAPRRKNDKSPGWAEEDAPEWTPMQFVEHVTASLAPVAWHLIRGLSQITPESLLDDDPAPPVEATLGV